MDQASVVLLLADPDDGEARLIGDRLTHRGVKVHRFDTASFPQHSTITAELGPGGWHGRISSPHGSIDLADIGAVFYRQSQPFVLSEGLSATEARFAQTEARFGLGGLLASLPVRWVPGTPGQVADAEYKPLQLAVAARCGLTIASTVLTNGAESARRFTEEQKSGAVYKVLMHKLLTDSGHPRLIYTTPVDAAEINERVAGTMHQFQANLSATKLFDARVVATRRSCIAVAIRTSDPAARQDFRLRYEALNYHQVDVPALVAAGCRRYLEGMRLRMGVFDFCVTAHDWYFLECGPGGQWAWLQEATSVPLADLIVDELIDTS